MLERLTSLLKTSAPTGPALWLVLGRGVGFVAAFAVPLVLVRVFDQTTFGTYKQLFLLYGTWYGLAQVGVAESLYYFLPRNSARAGRHTVNAVATLMVMGTASALLMLWAAPAAARWLMNPELEPMLGLLGLFLGLMLVSAAFEIALVARGRYRLAASAYAASDAGRALFVIVPAIAIGGLRGVMWGAIAFAGLRVAAMALVLGREFRGGLRPSPALWRSQWTYTLPFAVAVGLEVLQANLHSYVVAARVDAAAFAVYAVGCLQIPLVDVLTTSSANVMMVKMAGDGFDRRGAAALALWHDTMRRLALVIFPLVTFLIVMAPDIITVLFTRRYLGSVPVFVLWTCTMVFAVPCVDAVLRAYAQTRFLFWLNVLRLAAVVALVPWCLSVFGLPGAVLAMLAATALVRAAGLVRIARLMGVGLGDALPWRSFATTALCALAAAVPVAALARVASIPRPAVVAGALAMYAAAYTLLCALGKETAAAPGAPALPDAVR